ncbi:MAG TPA: TetR/AcrR family transcriptional regulator [Ktedonobacterales bacterium]|jgi:AcrR family transcriptional regulator|nr:TetR/AcrR family transcriptional regulator [Ktedonobacterales bacterium]
MSEATENRTTEREGRALHTAHGEAQRQALARAAYQVIAESGFEGLRTRDVAERVGVNIATLHYYFATKEDLIRGVVDLLITEFSTFRAPGQPPLEELSPREGLRSELEDVREQIRTRPDMFIALIELYMRSLRDPQIRVMLRELDAGWREHLESLLAAGVATGDFPSNLDIRTTSAVLIAFSKGMAMQLLSDPESVPIESVYDEIARLTTAHDSD